MRLLELKQALFEGAVRDLFATIAIPTEDDVQDACAVALRQAGLKAYREARYPTAPTSKSTDHIDIVATDGTSEDWLEIKVFKDIDGFHLNSKVHINQGIPGQIGRDIRKLSKLPSSSGRFFLAVGYFTSSANSTWGSAIEGALEGQGAPLSQCGWQFAERSKRGGSVAARVLSRGTKRPINLTRTQYKITLPTNGT